MWLFTHEPKAIARSLLLADLLGALLASILLFVGERAGFGTYTYGNYGYETNIPHVVLPFWDSFFMHLLFGCFTAFIGLFLVLLYAIPVMVVLRKFHLGGPLMALSVGLFPGVLLLALKRFVFGGFVLGFVFILFGLSVMLVFCIFAYCRHVL